VAGAPGCLEYALDRGALDFSGNRIWMGRQMVGSVEQVRLQVEVVGCSTICRHCWAQGVSYPVMPLDDVAWVLEQAHRFCDEHGLGFGAYPMHELAAHPQAAEILRLFAGHIGAAEFEPLATTGVPLANRADWPQLLAATARLGTTTVWVAFHGLGAIHDRQVNRAGAYAETTLAIQRVHAAGLRAGCNVFLTKANLHQAERLLGALQRLEVEGMWWGPASYYPTPRGRRNEPLRPGLSDLRPLAARIPHVSQFDHDIWKNLAAHTEAAWVRRALTGDWPEPPPSGGRVLELVCRPNLDLHRGDAGLYRERHGNLRHDGGQIVLARALAAGGHPTDALWFSLDPLPGLAELASRHGDPHGQGMHFTAMSVRYLWLDRAQRASG
jgi:hypothetical protein